MGGDQNRIVSKIPKMSNFLLCLVKKSNISGIPKSGEGVIKKKSLILLDFEARGGGGIFESSRRDKI